MTDLQWTPNGPTDWMADASCRGMDPNLFVPRTTAEVQQAKRICNGVKATRTTPGIPACPVKDQCLEYCLSIPGLVLGVWGGTSDRDRRVIRRERNVDNPRRRFQHGTVRGYVLHKKNGTPVCDSCLRANRAKAQAWRDRNKDHTTMPALAQLLQLVGLVHRQGVADGRQSPRETS